LMNKNIQLPAGLRSFGPASAAPRLSEGFFYAPLEENKDAYRFTVLADVAKIPDILQRFARLLPGDAFFILEYYPQDVSDINWSQGEEIIPEVAYSPYLPTALLMETLAPFLPRLIHDGFVGFGIANSREGLELFYSEEKVLTFFTGNHLQISNLLQQAGVPFNPQLSLPTDFEHEHLALANMGRRQLPPELAELPISALDYRNFGAELTELLEMYPVDEGPSFFLTKKEQDQIEAYLQQHPELSDWAEEEFGNLLLDWVDFVDECRKGFEGDLWEYRQALALRDLIQGVASGVPAPLSAKLMEIVRESDERFRDLLTDRHKRLDGAGGATDRFWHQGIINNPGSTLRRDLIRSGWYRH